MFRAAGPRKTTHQFRNTNCYQYLTSPILATSHCGDWHGSVGANGQPVVKAPMNIKQRAPLLQLGNNQDDMWETSNKSSLWVPDTATPWFRQQRELSLKRQWPSIAEHLQSLGILPKEWPPEEGTNVQPNMRQPYTDRSIDPTNFKRISPEFFQLLKKHDDGVIKLHGMPGRFLRYPRQRKRAAKQFVDASVNTENCGDRGVADATCPCQPVCERLSSKTEEKYIATDDDYLAATNMEKAVTVHGFQFQLREERICQQQPGECYEGRSSLADEQKLKAKDYGGNTMQTNAARTEQQVNMTSKQYSPQDGACIAHDRDCIAIGGDAATASKFECSVQTTARPRIGKRRRSSRRAHSSENFDNIPSTSVSAPAATQWSSQHTSDSIDANTKCRGQCKPEDETILGRSLKFFFGKNSKQPPNRAVSNDRYERGRDVERRSSLKSSTVNRCECPLTQPGTSPSIRNTYSGQEKVVGVSVGHNFGQGKVQFIKCGRGQRAASPYATETKTTAHTDHQNSTLRSRRSRHRGGLPDKHPGLGHSHESETSDHSSPQRLHRNMSSVSYRPVQSHPKLGHSSNSQTYLHKSPGVRKCMLSLCSRLSMSSPKDGQDDSRVTRSSRASNASTRSSNQRKGSINSERARSLSSPLGARKPMHSSLKLGHNVNSATFISKHKSLRSHCSSSCSCVSTSSFPKPGHRTNSVLHIHNQRRSGKRSALSIWKLKRSTPKAGHNVNSVTNIRKYKSLRRHCSSSCSCASMNAFPKPGHSSSSVKRLHTQRRSRKRSSFSTGKLKCSTPKSTHNDNSQTNIRKHKRSTRQCSSSCSCASTTSFPKTGHSVISEVCIYKPPGWEKQCSSTGSAKSTHSYPKPGHREYSETQTHPKKFNFFAGLCKSIRSRSNSEKRSSVSRYRIKRKSSTASSQSTPIYPRSGHSADSEPNAGKKARPRKIKSSSGSGSLLMTSPAIGHHAIFNFSEKEAVQSCIIKCKQGQDDDTDPRNTRRKRKNQICEIWMKPNSTYMRHSQTSISPCSGLDACERPDPATSLQRRRGHKELQRKQKKSHLSLREKHVQNVQNAERGFKMSEPRLKHQNQRISESDDELATPSTKGQRHRHVQNLYKDKGYKPSICKKYTHPRVHGFIYPGFSCEEEYESAEKEQQPSPTDADLAAPEPVKGDDHEPTAVSAEETNVAQSEDDKTAVIKPPPGQVNVTDASDNEEKTVAASTQTADSQNDNEKRETFGKSIFAKSGTVKESHKKPPAKRVLNNSEADDENSSGEDGLKPKQVAKKEQPDLTTNVILINREESVNWVNANDNYPTSYKKAGRQLRKDKFLLARHRDKLATSDHPDDCKKMGADYCRKMRLMRRFEAEQQEARKQEEIRMQHRARNEQILLRRERRLQEERKACCSAIELSKRPSNFSRWDRGGRDESADRKSHRPSVLFYDSKKTRDPTEKCLCCYGRRRSESRGRDKENESPRRSGKFADGAPVEKCRCCFSKGRSKSRDHDWENESPRRSGKFADGESHEKWQWRDKENESLRRNGKVKDGAASEECRCCYGRRRSESRGRDKENESGRRSGKLVEDVPDDKWRCCFSKSRSKSRSSDRQNESPRRRGQFADGATDQKWRWRDKENESRKRSGKFKDGAANEECRCCYGRRRAESRGRSSKFEDGPANDSFDSEDDFDRKPGYVLGQRNRNRRPFRDSNYA